VTIAAFASHSAAAEVQSAVGLLHGDLELPTRVCGVTRNSALDSPRAIGADDGSPRAGAVAEAHVDVVDAAHEIETLRLGETVQQCESVAERDGLDREAILVEAATSLVYIGAGSSGCRARCAGCRPLADGRRSFRPDISTRGTGPDDAPAGVGEGETVGLELTRLPRDEAVLALAILRLDARTHFGAVSAQRADALAARG